MEEEKKHVYAKDWRGYVKEMFSTAQVYVWVWRELLGRGMGRNILKVTLSALANSVILMTVPAVVAVILDAVVKGGGTRLYYGFVGLVALYLMGIVTEYAYDYFREYTIGEVIGRLERRTTELFFEKSLGQHLAESGKLSTASIERGFYRAMDMANVILDGLPVVAEIIVTYVLLWWLSPWIGLAATVLLVNHVVWTVFMNQRVVVEADKVEEDWRNMGRYRAERWDNIERVKTCARVQKERSYLENWFQRVITADRHLWLWTPKVTSGRTLMGDLIILASLGYGLQLVLQGKFSIGTIYPLYSWLSIFGRQVIQFGRLERRLTWNAPSVRSMMETLTMPPDVREKPDAARLAANIPVRVAFASVSHDYGSKPGVVPTPVLKNVTFTIEPGEKVALLGASGAGKTTLMRLLQRYMDPSAGAVLVNNIDLRDLRLDSWCEVVGYVPQAPQVLDGTIRYNLTYGLAEGDQRDDDTLWKLMRDLRIDFGPRLTEGLETKVGRRGLKLSGGQAQRLMLGAAVAKRPKFLIVDEATSSLDSTTEKEVQAGLARALAGDVSALIIAHRLSTVRDICSKFVVLRPAEEVKDGESQVEAVAGSFETLYVSSPTFRRLADDQGLVIA